MKLKYKYEKRAITLSVILKSYLFVTAPSLTYSDFLDLISFTSKMIPLKGAISISQL